MRVLVPFTALLSVVNALSFPGLLQRVPGDVCASLNTELVVPDLLGVLAAVGVIDTCICLSDLPVFLQTNVVAILAVTIAGEDVVRDILTQLIENGAPVGLCQYPDNSIPQCVGGDPCGFVCTNGFTRSGDDCICQAPSQVCSNGICTAQGCPSSTPQRRGTPSLWQKRTDCAVGSTACGTTSSYRFYECVHTATDLESCGGCSIPLDGNSPRGQDCSSIPGVTDVSCYNGACRVDGCMPGYRVSSNRRTCYLEEQLRNIKELIPSPYKMTVDLI